MKIGFDQLCEMGAVDFSSKIAMPLDFTAECTELRRGLKTVSKLCALRGDKSLDFQTMSVNALSINPVISDDHQICDIRSNVAFIIKSRMQTNARNCTNFTVVKSSDFTKNFDCAAFDEHFKQCGSFIALPLKSRFHSQAGVGNGDH